MIECDRCGAECANRFDLFAHRHRFDLFSTCDRRRVRQFWAFLVGEEPCPGGDE